MNAARKADADDAPCGLSYRELEVACRNIGFNLTCGACAELFFTGACGHDHNETCTTHHRSPGLTIEVSDG